MIDNGHTEFDDAMAEWHRIASELYGCLKALTEAINIAELEEAKYQMDVAEELINKYGGNQ